MGRKPEYSDYDYAPSFVVEDDTGTAYVEPDGSSLRMELREKVTVPGGEEPPPNVREFIERETDLDPVHRRKRWVEEYRLPIGDPVYVAGQADPGAAPDGSATTAIGDGLKTPTFFISDDPDHDLETQLWGGALVSFIAAAVLFAAAYMVYVN